MVIESSISNDELLLFSDFDDGHSYMAAVQEEVVMTDAVERTGSGSQ